MPWTLIVLVLVLSTHKTKLTRLIDIELAVIITLFVVRCSLNFRL